MGGPGVSLLHPCWGRPQNPLQPLPPPSRPLSASRAQSRLRSPGGGRTRGLYTVAMIPSEAGPPRLQPHSAGEHPETQGPDLGSRDGFREVAFRLLLDGEVSSSPGLTPLPPTFARWPAGRYQQPGLGKESGVRGGQRAVAPPDPSVTPLLHCPWTPPP